MRKLLTILLLLFAINGLEVQASTYIEGIDDGYEGTSINVEAEDYTLYIDGQEYQQGTTYNNVGHHIMSVYDGENLLEEINFTIHPHLGTEITLLGRTTLYNELHLELRNNGKIVCFVDLQNTPLPVTFTDIGTYNVVIFGANGYVKEYNFTLVDGSFEDIESNIIDSDFTLDPEPYQYLEINGQEITEVFLFDTYGFYYVKTVGRNGYEHFRILHNPLPEDEITDNKDYKSFDVNIEHSTQVIVNGEIITEDTKLEDIGYYTITYIGINDYIRTFNITIIEDPIRIDQGEILDEFSIKAMNAELYLNGELYTPNTKITTIGDYVFIIKGVGGYEKAIYFSIRHDYPFEDQDQLPKATNIEIDAKAILVNGKEVDYGYRIHETGSYKIVIVGEGGFRDEITVSYTNPNDPYTPMFNYVAYSLAGVMGLLYLVILWRKKR